MRLEDMKSHIRTNIFFIVSCLFIAFVSAIDIYWLIKNDHIISVTEQNPLGVWLINKDGGDVALFAMVKMLTNFFVIGVLVTLFKRWNRTKAVFITSVIACLQLTLLSYLFLDPGHIKRTIYYIQYTMT
jgi:hypothetical protein